MNTHSRDKSKRNASSGRPNASKASSARQKYERYLALARAEAGSGDSVAAENYFQHAEHYFRTSNGNGDKLSIEA